MQTNEQQLDKKDADCQQWFRVAVVHLIASFVNHKSSLTDLLLDLLAVRTQGDNMFSKSDESSNTPVSSLGP